MGKKIHNEEINDLKCSPNDVLVIKSKRVRWAVYVARIGDRRGAYRVFDEETSRKETTRETQA